MENIVIIGGGASGMFAALALSKKANVTILEKNDKLGKKLDITGKGRCNLTFSGDFDYMSQNIIENSKFMFSSFNILDNNAVVKLVNDLGVETKKERGNRIFLKNDDAKQLTIALKNEIYKNNIDVKYNHKVVDINIVEDGKINIICENKKEYLADKCIIATGGASYTSTGSEGDGYVLAKKLGHTIKDIKPGLVGLKSSDEICKICQGLTLKNVAIEVLVDEKSVYDDFGEMMFTHFGVTGPIILSSSSIISRINDLKGKLKSGNVMLKIDLKPAIDIDTLDKRILRDFAKYSNKELKNALNDLLPKKIIPQVILKSKLSENKKVNTLSKKERLSLVNTIKNLKILISDLMPIETGIITIGGVDLKQINPKTLESKLIPNVYFVGEVLDLDALTGGFNLQIAFSTGYACGYNILNKK